MKFVKYLLALSVAALALVPMTSLSKDNSSDVVVLTSKNTIILNGVVDGDSVSAVIKKAQELNAGLGGFKGINDSVGSKKPLYLYLNTPGGSIQAGLELIESLKGLGRPVHTITGFAASMGWQICQNMDTRYIIRNGVLMSHRAAGGFEGSFGGEGPSQVDNRYHLWLQRTKEMDEQTVKRTNGKQTLASYQHQYASEMWLTGSEAVAQGYADKVATVRCDKSLDGFSQHEVLLMGMIPVTYELSDCPLNSAPVNVKIKIDTNKGPLSEDEFSQRNGQFGPACLASPTNTTQVCALDTTLSPAKLKELKKTFVSGYLNKQRQVIDAY